MTPGEEGGYTQSSVVTLHRERTRNVQVGLLTFGALLLGFLLALQLRTGRVIESQLNIPSHQVESLGYLLSQREQTRAVLEKQIVALRAELAAYEETAGAHKAALAAMAEELARLKERSGLTSLQGPGVVVELKDSTKPLKAGEDPNLVILHYTDIQSVVNELWAAGAEAVAINGERLTAVSGINCVGTTILVNKKRIAPPYRIAALGDPEKLTQYLLRPEGQLAVLASFGFPVRVHTEASVTIPAYAGSLHLTYARPDHQEVRRSKS